MNEAGPVKQPTAAEVLAEAERRRRARAQPPMDERRRRVVILADRFVFWLSKHWLAVFNGLAFIYVGLPVLAPVLMMLGSEGPAVVIHTIYRPLCHQLPHRSWFLFGPRFAYRLPELVELVGADAVTGLWARNFVGNEAVGYKVAICQRDVAIYGTIMLAGLVYGLLRRWWKVPPLPWWAYLGLGILPLVADGGYQFLSYALPLLLPDFPISPHESTPLVRTVTGTLFGLATVWLAYPHVQEAMDEFNETLKRRFGWR